MKLFDRPIKYYFKKKNIFSFIRGKLIGKDLTQSYMEQFMYRWTHPKCKPCVESGKCIMPCKCDTYAKMLDPKSECDGTNENGVPFWGPMADDKSWKEWKDLVGLEFNQVRTKVKEKDDGSK